MRSEGRDARAYAKRLTWTFAVLVALTWVGSASAQTPPPPEDVPAVSAYVELVPTSEGSRSPSVGPGGTVKLPPRLEAAIAREGGEDAPLLEQVTTSRALGAPPSSRRPRRPIALPRTRDQAPLAAGVGVLTDGSNGRLLLLALVLVGTTAGVAGVAAYGRRAT